MATSSIPPHCAEEYEPALTRTQQTSVKFLLETFPEVIIFEPQEWLTEHFERLSTNEQNQVDKRLRNQ